MEAVRLIGDIGVAVAVDPSLPIYEGRGQERGSELYCAMLTGPEGIES